MMHQKSIILGCDKADYLAALIHSLKENGFQHHTIISASSAYALPGISLNMDADAVVLCFKNNQTVLDDLTATDHYRSMPILCFAGKKDCDKLRWKKGSLVYTCPLELMADNDCLCSRVHSFFMMTESLARNPSSYSFADTEERSRNNLNNKTLGRYVMELDHKTEILQKLRSRITHLHEQEDVNMRNELLSIANSIKTNSSENKIWEDFRMFYDNADPDFINVLSKRHPELTQRDLKYCCYLKMNLSNDDIRNLLGINPESVRMHKYRLKKKMNLPKEQELTSYLRLMGLALGGV
jgi:DNA-binding CsgD family transcriptional regulator